MNVSKIKCGLRQHYISAADLRAHREKEYTINLIKNFHPEWTQNDPTYQQCRDYYRGLPST